jgi:hypothetical protein
VVTGLAGGAQLLLRAGYSMTQPPPRSKFAFGPECVARLNGILKSFLGTHNFHNFSPNVTPEQMSAQRCAHLGPSHFCAILTLQPASVHLATPVRGQHLVRCACRAIARNVSW